MKKISELPYPYKEMALVNQENTLGHRNEDINLREDYNGLYSYDTGWTGNFQINYKFSKKSDMLYDESYQLYATPI